jgi:hypothetical protein
MSKRNREKRKCARLGLVSTIASRLKTEFQCTDDQIEMITHAFEKMYPADIMTHFQQVMDGAYKMREINFSIDLEDGTGPQEMTFGYNPITCLSDYLYKTYDRDFALLYSSAILTASPQKYLEMFPFFRNVINVREEVQG